MEFRKYHKIKILGDLDNVGIFDDEDDDIIIQEKMDGANFRFFIKDGNIIFGTRTQQITSNKGEPSNVQKNFTRCIDYVREVFWSNIDITESKKLEGYIFYGECMTKHTMNYDWDKVPPFLGFDIWDIKNERWVDYSEMADIYQGLGLEIVPLIKIVKSKEISQVTDDDVPQSVYCLDKAEGVVIKNYNKQLFAKFVREKFKEANRKNFGELKKFAKTDDEFLTAVYCTNARVDKMVFKLIDEGLKLDMTMMKYLPNRVYKDIWEEHWEEITTTKNKSCNFQLFKKLVTGKCLIILKQSIINNALSNKNVHADAVVKIQNE